MSKLRKTLFISEKKEAVDNTRFKYYCNYIFYDHNSGKWREDRTYFDDEELTITYWKKRGYLIR